MSAAKTLSQKPPSKSVPCFTCPRLHCGHKLLNAKGMMIHVSRCKWGNEFKVHKNHGHQRVPRQDSIGSAEKGTQKILIRGNRAPTSIQSWLKTSKSKTVNTTSNGVTVVTFVTYHERLSGGSIYIKQKTQTATGDIPKLQGDDSR